MDRIKNEIKQILIFSSNPLSTFQFLKLNNCLNKTNMICKNWLKMENECIIGEVLLTGMNWS